jgi:hypothetical protein
MMDNTQRLGGIKTPLEKLGHGEHPGPHVERHQHPPQHQQAPGVQFVVSHGHTIGAPDPASPTRCSEPIFEEKIEAPTTHQPRLRPARK